MSSQVHIFNRSGTAGVALALADPASLRRGTRRLLCMLALLGAAPLLGGCQAALLDPKGPIGADEKSLIILATCLMLVVVVPVIVMTLAFAWRYRETNPTKRFAPDWDHSSRIELVVWLVPCVIVAILAVVTWTSTHRLDPYRPIASHVKPIDVDVVSLDWKWLFIYPQLKVASVNELAFPAGTPVHFRLTSATVMNVFFIPRLGSQIYTMAGMQTQLNLLADEARNYHGISANFSGDGFSRMTFNARAMTQNDFQSWVSKVRASHDALTLAAYRQLARPSENLPIAYYSSVDPMLYRDILNECTDGGRCIDDDMKGPMADGMKLSMTQSIPMHASAGKKGK